jgi:hypothetical protein
MTDNPKEYDGIFFSPMVEQEGMDFIFFRYKDELANLPSVDGNSAGDRYHVAFYRVEDDKPVLEDSFETIFIDPEVYVNGLIGMHRYGTIARKTAKSSEFFKDYLKAVEQAIIITQQKFKEIRK